MGFPCGEAAHVAEQNFLVGHTQLGAQQGTALRVAGGKPCGINTVGNDCEGRFAVKHLPGLLAAGKAVGQARAEKAAHDPVTAA